MDSIDYKILKILQKNARETASNISKEIHLSVSAVIERIRKLEENVTLQQFHLDNHRPERLLELDNEYHQMLFEIAEKTQVFVLMESISIHYDRVRSLALKAIKDIKTVDDHRMILKAVSEGNAEEAKRLMEKHLNRYKVDRETMESAYPQYFKA